MVNLDFAKECGDLVMVVLASSDNSLSDENKAKPSGVAPLWSDIENDGSWASVVPGGES